MPKYVTLGDIQSALVEMKSDGMTLNSIEYVLERVYYEDFDRRAEESPAAVKPVSETVYATCAVGVFGPLGQNAQYHSNLEEAVKAANDANAKFGFSTGPVMRDKITHEGKEFFTDWRAIPGHEKWSEETGWVS